MGLLNIFGSKNKSSVSASAPDIADLPPIPEPDSNLDALSLDNLTSMDLPDLPTGDLSLDPLSELPSDDSLNTVPSNDLSELSPDHPLPNLSPHDLDPSLPKIPVEQKSPVNEVLPVKEVPIISEEPINKESITDIDTNLTQESSVVPVSKVESSLPVFEEDNPSQLDMESLTISELFIKREQYGRVLETLHNTQKELDVLVKKSALAKPNEKIGTLLKKATTKHVELNKKLMFVEEHLIE